MSAKTSQKGNNSRQKAYELIQKMILQMEVKPGEVVTEISLSERLGIGRTPVREALKRLEQEGLITTSNRRKRVYVLTVKEVEEIFDIKVFLEGKVARMAARNRTEKDRKLLVKTFQAMMDIAETEVTEGKEEEEKLKEWIEADHKLHAALFHIAGNKKIEHIIESLNLQWQRMRIGIFMLEGRIKKSALEHEVFVNAVIDGKPEEAEAAMVVHLEAVKKELVNILKFFHYPLQ